MQTLGDMRGESSLVSVSGTCGTGQDFADKVNESCRRLLRRGDWLDATKLVFLCVYQGCVVWPRYILEIRKVNFCNRPVEVKAMGYQFMEGNQKRCWNGLAGPPAGLHATGQSAVLQDVMGEGRLIRAYARKRLDLGKTLTIFGLDNNNQPLQHQDANGNWVPGALVTLADPFGSTNTFVRKIDYVVKDETADIVDVYAYNSVTNLLEDIAHYEPGETTPTYTRYQLNTHWPFAGSSAIQPNCCGQQRGLLAEVKLRFIKAKYDTDLVLINADAIKQMFMCLKSEEAMDREAAREYEAAAVEILNRELEENQPEDQFPAINNVLGPFTFNNQAF